jgi:UDP-3-O-[3-hydroxymyristoyl] glucosamine N-acyltransferase
MRVRELAARLAAPWEGDGDHELTGVADLGQAGPGDLAFVGQRKAAAQARESAAGCLLAAPGVDCGPRTVIRVPSPRNAFARAAGWFFPPLPLVSGIHPSAVVADSAVVAPSAAVGPFVTVGRGARIGERVQIGEGCSLGERVVIGDDSRLYPRVTIYADVVLGARCIVHSGCVLGADGFGFIREQERYEKFPQLGRVEIGDDVELGANTCIDRAALGVTLIGDGVKLDNLVHIGHNCHIGRHVLIAAQTGLAGGVVVEDYAVIGGQVGIGDKARIESGAVLGSGCGILTSKIVRRGQVVWGTPARPLKEHLEQLANLARLPELRRAVAELKAKVEKQSSCSSS